MQHLVFWYRRTRVGGRGSCKAVLSVKMNEMASSVDLGGSSKYSKEKL